MNEVYIVDGARTPFLKARSKPGLFSASDLAVQAGRDLLAYQPFEATDIDEVILGCVIPSADETNIARLVALRLGCGKQVPAFTVQRNCASGLQAVDSAYKDIACGRHHLVLAGGTEAMSRSPVLYNRHMVNWMASWMHAKGFTQKLKQLSTFRMRNLSPEFALLKGLKDPFVGLSMGQTAENIAARFGITRQQMDLYALASQQRLVAAQDKHRLGEIATIYDHDGHYYSADDGVRRDSSLEKLAKLKPFFDKTFGNLTAGNSSQVSDGAAWLVLASAKAVKRYGLQVLGRIVDTEWAGCPPSEMGLGPVHAATPLLGRHGLAKDDIDYWEINEAFSAQVLGCLAAWQDDAYCQEHLRLPRAFGRIDPERLNVDGGAIALGHPVGASGARLVLHLLQVLRRNKAHRGVASLCIGGGQGGAMLIENTAGARS